MFKDKLLVPCIIVTSLLWTIAPLVSAKSNFSFVAVDEPILSVVVLYTGLGVTLKKEFTLHGDSNMELYKRSPLVATAAIRKNEFGTFL